MNRNSKELARRIDVEVAYQNGAEMEYRNTGTHKWVELSEGGVLSFNWMSCDFRVKRVLIEGYVDPAEIHTPPPGGCVQLGCIHVREVEGE